MLNHSSDPHVKLSAASSVATAPTPPHAAATAAGSFNDTVSVVESAEGGFELVMLRSAAPSEQVFKSYGERPAVKPDGSFKTHS